jgi:hypothetical protein
VFAFTFIIINNFKFINTQNSVCEVIVPDSIKCSSQQILDLKQEFKNISNNLNENNKTFAEFLLDTPTLGDEIPENVFIDIKFNSISILESNFTRINSNAFISSSTSQYTTGFYWASASSSKLRNEPPYYDFYLALSSLEKLDYLYINLDSDIIHEIPDHAFDRTVNQSIHLNRLYFNGNFSISRIGNYAFYSMSTIKYIYFFVNSIQYISAHAFDFQFSSDTIAEIYMNGVQLDETCLAYGIFQSPIRKMELFLSID